MNLKPTIIRTDGGASVGFGHVRRCLTLARQLTRLDTDVQFLCDGPAAVHELIAAEGFQATPVDLPYDLEQTRRKIRETSAQIVIVDSYDLGEEYLAALSSEKIKVVAIDDLAQHRFPVDVVVNGSANASELQYAALPETQFLLGTAYALVREEFVADSRRQCSGFVRRVLVTMGGSDPWQLTPRVVGWIREILPSVKVDVILGPLVEQKSAAARECQSVSGVEVHSSPTRVDELMRRADLAVSGGGQTCYELAATGTPTMAICVAENQRGQLSALSREGGLEVAGSADDPDLGLNLKTKLFNLAGDFDQRRKMAAKGLQLVDGKGAKRVAGAIMNLAESRCCQAAS